MHVIDNNIPNHRIQYAIFLGVLWLKVIIADCP